MANESSGILAIDTIEGGLRLSGEIDASCTDLLARHLDPLPGSAGDITIHLGGVTFIDSSGLRGLLNAHQCAELAGRRVLMTEPSPVVARLFELTGLSYLHVV